MPAIPPTLLPMAMASSTEAGLTPVRPPITRGLISAPLSGELLAAWICGEPLPLPRAVAEACHPNRFLLRDLVRGQRG